MARNGEILYNMQIDWIVLQIILAPFDWPSFVPLSNHRRLSGGSHTTQKLSIESERRPMMIPLSISTPPLDLAYAILYSSIIAYSHTTSTFCVGRVGCIWHIGRRTPAVLCFRVYSGSALTPHTTSTSSNISLRDESEMAKNGSCLGAFHQ